MIQILAPNLRDQIAAGEVVERPASIVKELVENAVDAGATEVEILVKGGGKDLIEVQDNGKGMSLKDAELSVERYATSKISKIEDLHNIHTFGFRGEALASIGSVSDFVIKTKQKQNLSGYKVQVKGGKKHKTQEVGAKDGTKVTVKDLFYNVPARLKFLKAETTENNYILKTIQNFAIMHPQVAFRYTNNTKKVLDLVAVDESVEGRKKRLEKMFRKELIEHMKPVSLNLGYLDVSGFAIAQSNPQSNRKYQYAFVNQRNVEDRTIKAAVNEAYQNLIPRGVFPAYFLFVEISPDLVDVNVHPRKTEVKFLKQQEIYLAVKKAVQEALATESRSVDFSRSDLGGVEEAAGHPWAGDAHGKGVTKGFQTSASPLLGQSTYSSKSYASSNYSNKPSKNEVSLALDFSKNLLNKNDSSSQFTDNSGKGIVEFQEEKEAFSWWIVGQVNRSYIVVEKEEQVFFIDQHAADERVKYEKIKADYQRKEQFKQHLLIPVKVEVSILQKNLLEENEENLKEIGYETQSLGGQTFLLNSVPAELSELDVEQTFLGMLDEFEDELKRKVEVGELLEQNFRYIACRSAVMFGDEMSLREMQYLVKTVFEHPEYQTCPHGRPFIWGVPFLELNKKFGR